MSVHPPPREFAATEGDAKRPASSPSPALRRRRRYPHPYAPSTRRRRSPPAKRTGQRHPAKSLPCRATRSSASWAAAAWASSTRPGRSGLNRLVALKMILAGGHADAAELARFRAEAEAVARLQHPNIVQIYEVGEHERPAVLLAGVRRGRQPGPARSASRCRRRAGGRGWSRSPGPGHAGTPTSRGVVHRDLKPANVLLGGRRHAEGPDHRLRPGQAARQGLGPDRDRRVMGTPSYMAPEQAAGKTPARSARRPTSTPWGRSSTSC